MIHRVVIFIGLSLFMLCSAYGQRPDPNQVVVVNGNETHAPHVLSASYNADSQELTIQWINSSSIYGLEIRSLKQVGSNYETEEIYEIPLQLENHVVDGYDDIEITLNFATDITIPNDDLDIYILLSEDEIYPTRYIKLNKGNN